MLPQYFRKGIASEMIKESFNIAKRIGYGAIFLWGNPDFYSKFDFIPTYRYNIRHIQFDNKNVDFIMVKELIEGTLNGICGTIDIY